jgi:Protein of unknown function (DUF3800)
MTLAHHMGTVAMLKAYMDESGVHDNSPVLTVAAYLGRPRAWEAWAKKWRVAKRPIKVFHAVDAANLSGEFKGWSAGERDGVVKKLLPVIAEADLVGLIVGIQMDEFRKAMAPHPELRALFASPYAACFQWLTQIIMNLQADVGSNERIGFVHETNDYQQEALEGFAWIKKYGNPQGSTIGLTFADKAKCTPLQAADILAYEGNKRMRDPGRPERRPWGILRSREALTAAHFGCENMHLLVEGLRKVKEGRISEINFDGDGWNRATGPWKTHPSLLQASE